MELKEIKQQQKGRQFKVLYDEYKGNKEFPIKLKLQSEDYNHEFLTYIINTIEIKTYEDGPKIVFSGFSHDTILDKKDCDNPSRPWDFSAPNLTKFTVYDNRKKIQFLRDWCIVIRIYEFNTLVEDISNELTEEEKNLSNFYKDKFLRIGNDECVEYGDGGQQFLCTPLYVNKALPVDPAIKKNLSDQLAKLGKERNDWDDECPVLDIIDPNLNPNYLAFTDIQKKIDDYVANEKKKQSWRDFSNEEEIGYFNQEVLTKFPESLSLRSHYKWIPSEILINKDLKARFMTPIYNLPLKNNSELYSNFLKVFEAMLPGFQRLNLLKENDDTTLQVVVKAQSYEIKPGMKYSGKWHIEGKTENIVAGGVYYCSIDNGFQVDKLLYRNITFPDLFQAEYINRLPDYEVPVEEGSAVVFSNTLPHRFYELLNMTSKTLTRTFINFFIVDPGNPIYSEVGKMEYWRILKAKKLKKIFIGHILSFLYLTPLDVLTAKEKRKKVRESMQTEKAGWGFIFHGNAGDVEFFDAFHEFKNPNKYDTIENDKGEREN